MRTALAPHSLLLALAATAVSLPSAVAAQDPAPARPTVSVATGVSPDTVTVGDPFQAAVRISVPPAARIEFPAAPAATEALEPIDSARVIGGAQPGEQTVVYRLVAWETGALTAAPLPIRVTLPDGTTQVYPVSLRLPWVASVLPADTAGVEPRGAKDVLDRADPRPHAAWLVLLALLLAAGLAYLLYRLMRGRAAAHEAELDPRTEALALLDRARSEGAERVGDWKPYFYLISGAVRGYLAALSPRWGTDLTTRELLAHMRASSTPAAEVDILRRVLDRADRVKFSRYQPTSAEAEEVWRLAREWVETAQPARVDEEVEVTQEAA